MFDLGKFGVTVELDTSHFDSGMASVEGKTKKASGGLGGFAKSVGKIAAGLGVFTLVSKGVDMVRNSLDGAIDRYDTLNNFPKVMQQIGFDAEMSQASIDKLSAGIQGLPTRLDEVANTAQSIAIMTGDLDSATDTTLALNNAFLASGAGAADAQRGIDQYTKMLSKGEVDLQSWRTLQETMPFALRETAEAFGYTGQSATNDFYEALKEGDITMSDFNSKLIELDTAQGGFAETAKTAARGIKTAWTNMQTWVVMGVAKIITSIDEAFGGVGAIEGMINSLKPIFDNTFTFIADMIVKAGDGIRDLKSWFDDFTTSMSGLKGTFEPLLQVMEREFERLKSNMQPALDALIKAWEGLEPILVTVGQILGVVLVGAVGILVGAFTGLMGLLGPLINALSNLISFVTNIVASLVALLRGDLTGALEHWGNAAEATINFFTSLFEGVIVFLASFVEGVVEFFHGLYMTLVGNSIIPDMINAIVDWFNNMFGWLIDIVSNLVDGVVEFFTALKERGTEIFEAFNEALQAVWDYIVNTFQNALDFLVALVTGDFEGMKTAMENQMNNAKNLLSNVWEIIKGLVGEKTLQILSDIITKFTDIKDNIQNKIEEAKQALINKFIEMVQNVTDKASEIVTTVKTKFEEAKDMITKPIEDAKNKVGDIVDDIKSFFSNMKLKLPKIEVPKLPKFSLSGDFSLKPPRVPKINIDWFKDGGIMTKPTAFGRRGNTILAGGEAGAEAILPLRTGVLEDIGRGISKTMQTQQATTNNTNNYSINLNVDNLSGTKEDARFVLSEIVKGVKKKGGRI